MASETSIIDCHCHLAASEFDEDMESIVAEARQAGVVKIVAVSEFVSDFQKIFDLTKRFPDLVYPSFGVHPVQAENRSVSLEDYAEAEELIRKHHGDLVAIGEVGLDFTPRYIKCSRDKDIQRDCFSKQIRLSKELHLPVNVHSRSAGRPVIDMLIKEDAKDVVLHAFDGKVSNALRGVEAGFFFSIPPCVVRSEQKQKLVKAIPIANMLLETDAPALGPEKQLRNEPKNILISCEEVSRIKGITEQEVRTITSKNALKLFSKLDR